MSPGTTLVDWVPTARRLRVVSLAAVIAALLPAAVVPARADAVIKVFSPERALLAKYSSVRCSVATIKGERRFTAAGTLGNKRLRVLIAPGDFRGFRTHVVRYGANGLANVHWGMGGHVWTNLNKPPTGPGPELTVAGSVQFPRGRRILRVGIAIMYDHDFGDDWVSVVGQAPCRY
ncbi:MAG: hypothetical protein H6531_09175 [Actinobacteria bacterium]|nr:hypothetical protein [Actinomycetota bacterium]